jgi:L-serine deaminase
MLDAEGTEHARDALEGAAPIAAAHHLGLINDRVARRVADHARKLNDAIAPSRRERCVLQARCLPRQGPPPPRQPSRAPSP